MKKKMLFWAGAIALAFTACAKDEGIEGVEDNGYDPNWKYVETSYTSFTVEGLPESKTEVAKNIPFNIMWCDNEATGSTTGTYIQSFADESYLEDSGNTITGGNGYEIESSRTAYAYATDSYLFNYSYGGGGFSKYSIAASGNASTGYAKVGNTINLGTAMGHNNGRVSLVGDAFSAGHNITTTNISNGSVYHTTEAAISVAFVAGLEGDGQMGVQQLGVALVPTTETLNDDGSEGTPCYAWRVHFPYVKTIDGKKMMYYGIARRRLVASSLETDGDYDATAALLVVEDGDFDTATIMEAPEFGGVRTTGQTYGYRTQPMCEDEVGNLYHVTMSDLRILKISGTTGVYDDTYDFDLKTALGNTTGNLDGTGMYYAGNIDGKEIAYVPYEDNNLTTTYKWGLARVNLTDKTAVALTLPANLNFWSYQQVRFNSAGTKMYMAICPYGETSGNIYVFDTTSDSPTAFDLGAKLSNAGSTTYFASLF